MEIVQNIPVDLDPNQLLEKIRVSPGTEDAVAFVRLLDRVKPIVNPKAIYDLCFVGEKGNDTVDIGSVVFTSRVLRVNLENAHRAFPYIATCGVELDAVPGLDDDPILEYWLDQIRITALFAARAYLRQHVDEKYRPGKMSSMSPGSLADWPITQQAQLFSIFGDVESKIGVKLTDSFLMLPMKSVSGILFPTETSFESCRLCPREICPGRSSPYDPGLWDRYTNAKG